MLPLKVLILEDLRGLALLSTSSQPIAAGDLAVKAHHVPHSDCSHEEEVQARRRSVRSTASREHQQVSSLPGVIRRTDSAHAASGVSLEGGLPTPRCLPTLQRAAGDSAYVRSRGDRTPAPTSCSYL